MNWFKGLFVNFWDQVLLLISALLLCFFGLLSFSLADDYKINPVWVFFAWNAILYLVFLIRKFRAHLKNRKFLAFLMACAILHGAIIIALMRFVPLAYWFLALFMEATAGLVAASSWFDVVPDDSSN